MVLFPNGTRKVISSDNLTCTVYFFNGDIKRTQPDGSVVSDMYSILTRVFEKLI